MVPRTSKTVLDNGIRVLTCHMPCTRSVTLGVWVNVGARDETPAENGLSHFIEHMIFKGTTHRSAFQIASEFDAIGGQSNAFTTMEHTCYHAQVLDTHVSTMVDIFTDIFLHSTFDPEELEKERPVILQEISMMEDQPDEFVHFLLENDFWGNTPLGRSITGTAENVRSFDASDIQLFFKRHYHPDRIVISAAGNIEHDHLVDLIAPSFNAIPSGLPSSPRCAPPINSGFNVYNKPIEQVHVCIGTKGLSLTDPRRYALSLLNTLLGGNMSSRLFQDIREKRGLAYSVYSFISSYIDTGMFGAYAAVHPDHLHESIELIIRGMQRFKTHRPDADALINAKEYTTSGLLMANESTENNMFRIAQNEINFKRQIPLKETIDRIETVSEDDILQLADSLFQSDSLALTLLGPVTHDDISQDIPGWL